MPRKKTRPGSRRFKEKPAKPKAAVKVPELSDQVVAESPPVEKKHWWRTAVWALAAVSLIGLMSLVISGWIYVRSFLNTAELSWSQLLETVQLGLSKNGFGVDGQVTFLLLGLDQTANRNGNSLLTDSLMLMMVSQDGTIGMISLPRDLWLNHLKTKINALYYYGEQEKPGQGEDKVKTAVEEITGIPVDYTLILTPSQLAQGIDSIGGIEVSVEESFRDDKYPRDDVDLQASAPDQLYKAVEFEQGVELMSGERAVEYSRSRMSQDLAQGNDVSRQRRQQALFGAWVNKLKSPEMVFNPAGYGRLYRWWKTNFGQEVPDWLMVSMANRLWSRPWRLVPITLTGTEASSQTDLLVVPPIEKYGLWVYEPVDPSWNAVKKAIQASLASRGEED